MIEQIKRRIKSLLSESKPFMHKRNNLISAINFVISNNIEGDYMEFGVFKGESFILAYQTYTHLFERYRKMNIGKPNIPFLNQKVRFFAFDSFEGLPENEDPDIPLHWTGDQPMSYPKYLFEKNLKKAKVDMNDVVMVEGFYDQTLTPQLYDEMQIKGASIIHIDCDLYESTKTVLDTIKPLIGDGTVIVFDDFFYYRGSPYKGERGAFNEWLNENPEMIATELCKYPPAVTYVISMRDESKPIDWIQA